MSLRNRDGVTHTALNNITLTIRAGQKVGIMGCTGRYILPLLNVRNTYNN